MKKFLSILLAATMMLSLCACSITDFIRTEDPDDQPILQSDVTITLDTYNLTLQAGETYQLEGYVQADKTLKWKSSNDSIALVNSRGLVTASAPGVANITCYASGAVEAICTVTVVGGTSSTPTTKPSSPSYSYTYDASGSIFPHSSHAYLTYDEIHRVLSNMTGYSPANSYSQDAINEIYARNGYIFKKDKIYAYYSAYSWYSPNPYFQESDLNKYEKANIALLLKYPE